MGCVKACTGGLENLSSSIFLFIWGLPVEGAGGLSERLQGWFMHFLGQFVREEGVQKLFGQRPNKRDALQNRASLKGLCLSLKKSLLDCSLLYTPKHFLFEPKL